MKGIVIFDSWTGNTKKVAQAVAEAGGFSIQQVDHAASDVSSYELLVVCTPDIRARATPKITAFLQKVIAPRYFVLCVTYGVPLWGQVSSAKCIKEMRACLEAKGSHYMGNFRCPGYHVKFRTYKNRPADHDLAKAQAMIKAICQEVQ